MTRMFEVQHLPPAQQIGPHFGEPWFLRTICRQEQDNDRQRAWTYCRFHGFLVGIACEPTLTLPPHWLPMLFVGLGMDHVSEQLARRILPEALEHYNGFRRELQEARLSMPALQDITLRNGWYGAFRLAQKFQLGSVQDDVIAQLLWKLAALASAVELPSGGEDSLAGQTWPKMQPASQLGMPVEMAMASVVIGLATYRRALEATRLTSQPKTGLRQTSYAH